MADDGFIGIDVGTSSVKAVAVSITGKVLASADSPVRVTVPAPGWAEHQPEEWWEATAKSVRAVTDKLPDSTTVKAISLSGQMHSLVALDASAQVVRPAILWSDVRTSAQCTAIRKIVGDDGLRGMCGNPALEGFTATKLLWMRDNEPENFRRINRFCLAKDFVRLRMTGELATEPSDAAGTLLMDVAKRRWSPKMCDLLNLDQSLLPPILESGGVAGTVTANAAELMGVPVGTPVAGGGADNACAAAGAGVVAAGTLLVSVGTSGTVVAPVSKPLVDPGMRIHSMAHVDPDVWYLMGVVLSAGAALAWWRNSVTDGSDSPGFDELVLGAAKTNPGADGLTFLPYLTGERTPHADANARGVFCGLHAGHTRAHMTRAVMEGISFALRESLDLMKPLGVSTDHAAAVGGGARSSTWLQMLSDILGVPLRTVGPAEGAPLGAAMLAAVATRTFGSLAEAGKAWLTTTGEAIPDAGNKDAYSAAYARYGSLYVHLKDWFKGQ
jgi:xylulokinase